MFTVGKHSDFWNSCIWKWDAKSYLKIIVIQYIKLSQYNWFNFCSVTQYNAVCKTKKTKFHCLTDRHNIAKRDIGELSFIKITFLHQLSHPIIGIISWRGFLLAMDKREFFQAKIRGNRRPFSKGLPIEEI